MLSRLVVHLQTNTGQFRSGLASVRPALATTAGGVSDLSTVVELNQRKLQSVGNVLVGLSTRFQAFGRVLQFVGGTAQLVASGLGVVGGVLSKAFVGLYAVIRFLSIAMLPVEGAFLALRAAAAALSAALRILLAPVRWLVGAFVGLFKAVWAVIAPFARVAIAIGTFWLKVKGTILAVKWFGALLAMLPPRLRVLVVALGALGAVARVSSVAVRLLGVASKVAATAFQLLTLPILAIKSPAAAAVVSLQLLRGALLRTVGAAAKATAAVTAFALSLSKRVAAGAAKASLAVGNFAAGLVGGLAKALLVVGAAGVAWGVGLAAQAEQAHVGFTTLLGSAELATAVLAELTEFSASTPFALNDLRDGAKLLLNAGVSTGALTRELTMLGDIAAGTGKPIGDFARIYSKAMATGKVTQETLNQLAERGVPIYSALQNSMGKSRSELVDMLSKGQVGFRQLHGALASTTAAGGVFAGGMAAQSQTLAGLWSTLKDNLGLVFQELSGSLMEAFDFRGLMARAIAFAGAVREGIVSITPVIQGFGKMVIAQFGAMWRNATAVWSALMGGGSVTFQDLVELAVTALAMAEFAFLNWESVSALAFLNVQLAALGFFGSVEHWFTSTVPALLSWFGDNWRDVFFSAFDLVSTIFINMGQNIRRIMSEIWAFIKSGGTASFSVAWTPLTDGFVSTLKSLPEIPPRVMGPLEKQLEQQAAALGGTLQTGMQDLVAERLAGLDEFKSRQAAELPDINAANPDDMDFGDDGAAKSEDKSESFGALEAGSGAAYSAIVEAMNRSRNDKESAQLKAVQAAAAAGQSTAANTETMAAGFRKGQTLAVVNSLAG